MIRFSARCCVFVLLLIVGEDVTADPQSIDYSVTSLCAPSCTLHEPVVFAIRVHNLGDQPVRADLGKNRELRFSFIIRPPQAQRVQIQPQVEEGVGLGGEILLDPGKQYDQQLVLNKWYQPDTPGTYRIMIHLGADFVKVGTDTTWRPPDEELTVTISPLDSSLLTQKCEALWDEIQQKKVYPEQENAVVRLTYTRDPVAVPFLMKMFSSYPLLGSTAISGLGRIGNQEAADALLSILHETNKSDMRALARNALLDIARSTQSDALKTYIQGELTNR